MRNRVVFHIFRKQNACHISNECNIIYDIKCLYCFGAKTGMVFYSKIVKLISQLHKNYNLFYIVFIINSFRYIPHRGNCIEGMGDREGGLV